MPVYTYRREDGTEFDVRQSFSDEPLTIDPETGQKVQRVIQPAGIVFKGSGFYVNDSRGSKSSLNGTNGTNGSNGKDAVKTNDTSTSKADASTPQSERAAS